MRKTPFFTLTLLVLGVTASLCAPQARALIYVDGADSNILSFPNVASGDISPTTNIQGAATTLGGLIYDVAVDANFIYVANPSYDNIAVFPTNADGDVAPARSIQGPATGLEQLSSITVTPPASTPKRLGNSWLYLLLLGDQ